MYVINFNLHDVLYEQLTFFSQIRNYITHGVTPHMSLSSDTVISRHITSYVDILISSLLDTRC